MRSLGGASLYKRIDDRNILISQNISYKIWKDTRNLDNKIFLNEKIIQKLFICVFFSAKT
jgi:hypothetical protein